MPIWNAFPPEINVGSLVGYPPLGIPRPPGVGTIESAAKSYAESGMALLDAAARTEAAMGNMGESWRGESAELAQSAFRNHTNWLIQQSQAAEQASAVLHSVAGEFKTAQSAMKIVRGMLIENKLERKILLATNQGGQNLFPLLINQLVYFAIWGAASGVLDAYAGVVMPTLSTLPPPALPEPIVTDPGVPPPPPQFQVPVYKPKSGIPQQFNRSTTANHNNTTTNNSTNTGTNSKTNTNTNNGSNNTGDTNTGDTNPGKTPTDTTQSPTQPSTADPSEITSPFSDSGSYAGTDGFAEQSGFPGTSPNSPTLAGLSGGAGSLVALNLARGGLGSMPGASTGFRMPSNWLRGPGTAYGASSNPAGTAPAGRAAPRRGAIAPKAQMRRRRDEERKPGKVFVPGEQVEVPVLEKPPVIGVIEYADERPEDVVADGDSLVGILERSDDDERSDDAAAVAEPEPAR
ncbi:PPE domain-containing protein [Nocardia sp. NPDC049707]|uniref:PPE domain-containing protein n=1 Tax=Nocardia sp. NPDC049707 TaxID=3154735 RepID=UPI0034320B13